MFFVKSMITGKSFSDLTGMTVALADMCNKRLKIILEDEDLSMEDWTNDAVFCGDTSRDYKATAVKEFPTGFTVSIDKKRKNLSHVLIPTNLPHGAAHQFVKKDARRHLVKVKGEIIQVVKGEISGNLECGLVILKRRIGEAKKHGKFDWKHEMAYNKSKKLIISSCSSSASARLMALRKIEEIEMLNKKLFKKPLAVT
jgi:hypothetical protein